MEKQNLTVQKEMASTKCTIHEVQETPFAIKEVTTYNEEGEKVNAECNIVIGNYLVSAKEFTCVEDAEVYIDERPYELIFNGAIAIFKMFSENESKQKDNH